MPPDPEPDRDDEDPWAIPDEARGLILEGIRRWVDQWPQTSGSIVTGYLLVCETARPDNLAVDVTWIQGDGNDVHHGSGGLPMHRASGLAAYVTNEINAMQIAERVRAAGDD